ncbi:MAG: hypothetical protein H0W10_06530 [Chloroflexi bacterium]|nr:hypothetical protein [Chloroflexota bacterium]
MSALQRAAAAAVVILVSIGVAVLAIGATGGPTAVVPTASAEPVRSASVAPSPSVQPSVPEEGEALAILREIEEQVIAIRGLPSAEIGPADLITRAELGSELERLFAEEYPPDDQRRDNISLRALGLLEPGQDVAELQLQLLGDQVLGFYDDIERRMVIVTDAGLDAEAKLTYAHEYTHALQDAAFGLDSLEIDADGEDDRGLARTALIEGDATVTMLAWAFEHLTPEELMEIGTGIELPDTTGIPSWMFNQLQFPYNEGSLWAGTLAGDPLSPRFADLDAAYADPPDSTEQIIDVDSWLAREAPVVVAVPDLAVVLGDGWEEVDATPIGEASIRIMLEYLGVPRETAYTAADGWGGDRAVIASGPDDAFALGWRLAWDTPADAAEFLSAYRTVVDALPFPATVLEVGDGQILVAHASSDDLLRRTVDAAND